MNYNTIVFRKLYGYFSQKIFDKFGGYIYLDENNKEVIVTSILSPDCDLFLYDDEKYVGVVTLFVRFVSNGSVQSKL